MCKGMDETGRYSECGILYCFLMKDNVRKMEKSDGYQLHGERKLFG